MSPGTVLGPVVADLRQVFLDLPQPVAVEGARDAVRGGRMSRGYRLSWGAAVIARMASSSVS